MTNFDRNALGMPGVARAGTYDAGLRAYMLGIYNYMTLGLALTALVALAVFKLSVTTDQAQAVGRVGGLMVTQFGATLFLSPLKWLFILAPLGFVLFLSFRFERMSLGALTGTFLAFAATMGVSMGTVFLVYKIGSVVQVFLVTAAAFGALSLYGYTTRRSLSGMGQFLMMGLFGLIIAGLVNLFLQSGPFQMALNAIGVLVFAGLTAWDTQRLKEQYDYIAGDAVAIGKASIMGALTLYLNFINMFQMLLSLMGNRNN